MPTFEHRRDAKGRVTAIRVKIRRVGLPHISRSFPVESDSPTALRKAAKAARDWAQATASTLAPSVTAASAASVPDPTPKPHGILATAWASAISVTTAEPPQAQGRRSPTRVPTEALLVSAPAGPGRALLALLLDCGLRLEELAALRWQRVHLNSGWLDVPGPGGLVLRQVPLTPLVISALLACGGRKYGLVFRRDADGLRQWLAELAPGFCAEDFQRACPLRMAQRGLGMAEIEAHMGVPDARALLTAPKGTPDGMGPDPTS